MNNIFTSMILVISIFISANTFAQTYTAYGKVKKIRSHVASIYVDWFAVEGFTAAGSCGTVGTDMPILFEDSERAKRQISMVMSAVMSGKVIEVNVDDSVKDVNGYCLLQWLTLEG